MVTTYQIPLTGISETFTISILNVTYTMTVKWNNSDQSGWILDLADSSQNPIACGIPLITGADLLAGLEYLGIGVSMFIVTSGDAEAVPTFTDLGTDSILTFQVVS